MNPEMLIRSSDHHVLTGVEKGIQAIPQTCKHSGMHHIVPCVVGDCAEGEGRAAGGGDRGVRLGVHGPHCRVGQHVPRRPRRPLWAAQHRRPDHLRQWHQSCWPASLQLSDHN